MQIRLNSLDMGWQQTQNNFIVSTYRSLASKQFYQNGIKFLAITIMATKWNYAYLRVRFTPIAPIKIP